MELKTSNMPPSGTQHSIVTILSTWSLMQGISTLTMPWAIQQAGFGLGMVLLMVMAGLMAYTAYIVITSGRHVTETVVNEFEDAVRIYLGKYAEIFALISSVVTLLGVCIIYWILISNFLYNIVVFSYGQFYEDHSNSSVETTSGDFDDVVCHNQTDISADFTESFKTIWNETNTVPLFIIILIFPTITLKSPTFFNKFNTLGVLSIAYLIIFVSVKAAMWGFNLDFEDSSLPAFTENFKSSFPSSSGVAEMAFYVHPTLMAITRGQKHPENNTRDVLIAYSLAFFTYTFIAVNFYSSFPLDKSCIEDNLLNNMASTDIMSLVARCLLFVQMTCALPLIMYALRSQVLQWFFGTMWPSLKHVVIHNLLVVTICVLFAVFMPKIGRIVSFVGALCGLSYAIALPCLVYLVSSHRRGTLTKLKLAFHCFIIIIGVANLIAQFVFVW